MLTRDGSSQWLGLLSCPALAAAHTRVIDIHTLHTNTGIHTEMEVHQHSLYTRAQWQLWPHGHLEAFNNRGTKYRSCRATMAESPAKNSLKWHNLEKYEQGW